MTTSPNVLNDPKVPFNTLVLQAMPTTRKGPRKMKRTERPPKLTPRDERRIESHFSNTTASLRSAPGELNLDVSKNTIHRVLKKSKTIVHKKKVKAPALIKKHKEDRLTFARAQVQRNWKKVIFSDEKKSNLDGPDNVAFYWHDLRKDPFLHTSRNIGGRSIMTWAAISAQGGVDLVFTGSKINSDDYIDVLKGSLEPFLAKFPNFGYVFQHDFAPIHTSCATRAYLQALNVPVLDWVLRYPI